jgi:hypothetical protein
MRHGLVLERGDSGKRAEHGVAVIGAAAAIELVALADGGPWAAAVAPAGHLRLLVEMAVEQHAVIARARNVDQYDRRALRQPHHLEARPGDAGELAPGPAGQQRHRVVHIAMRHPIRVEGRRFVGNADVVDELRHDLVGPALLDKARELGLIHRSIYPFCASAATRPRCSSSASNLGSRPRKAV